MIQKLPSLEYEYDSLEPIIDEQTMHLHRDKHHQGCLNKLNNALEDYPELDKKTEQLSELIKNPEQLPDEIKTKVLQNGGQFLNHNLFFSILKKDVEINGEILDAINEKFGSFEAFKEKFSDAALSIFGSGWAWLSLDQGNLEISTTPNHENPLMDGKEPILNLDMWEHAYYLKYKNDKKTYVENFFQIINWEKVNELYKIKKEVQ